jgi:hypothetical protein
MGEVTSPDVIYEGSSDRGFLELMSRSADVAAGDGKALEGLECQHRIFETCERRGVFEVEVSSGSFATVGNLTGERGLADLSRPEQRNNRAVSQQLRALE